MIFWFATQNQQRTSGGQKVAGIEGGAAVWSGCSMSAFIFSISAIFLYFFLEFTQQICPYNVIFSGLYPSIFL